MRLALLLVFTLTLACIKPAGPVLWQTGPLKVLLTETHSMDERYAQYRLEVTDGKRRLCFSSSAMGSPRERRANFNQVINQDGYLFVPTSCGGGNASKCQGYQAFATTPKLRWLGNLTGRRTEQDQNVVVYDKGIFYDTGDQLEINDLLSHAASPRYVVAYTAGAQSLVFDPARTWAENARAYGEAQDDPPGLLMRAGLAKLCGRSKELTALNAKAKSLFNPGQFKAYQNSLKQVALGASRPNAFIPLNDCTP